MYPPQQFMREDSFKPDGSLGAIYIAGALRRAGYDVAVLDACVGNENFSLEDTFFRHRELPNGLVRIGMSLDDISRAVADYDVIGLTNLFTLQTTRVVEVVEHIKRTYPSKLVFVGGTNARHMAGRFLSAGADLVFLSEAEQTILDVAHRLRRGDADFSDVAGIAFMNDGKVVARPMGPVVSNLDELAFPAWDLLPLERYWHLARPHGGGFRPEDKTRYASMMTSRGCPFRCAFCHISKEQNGSHTGNLAQVRLKSIGRVLEEFDILQDLGVEYIFLEDDSLFAKKKRAIEIFREVARRRLKLSDVNGVNIIHLCRPREGKLVADEELFEVLAEAGFTELTLPFESGSQRIIDKYATAKLDLERVDTTSIIRTARRLGITVGGNYLIGWPDESLDEIRATVMLAKRHMEDGMCRANMMCVVPFPGTKLFDMAVANGHFPQDFDPDRMNWLHPTMRNTSVDPEVVDFLNDVVWKLLNPSNRIATVTGLSAG
jgi:radical SAM superfamily enzyme YgiQ (UPF0313 family)